jgi:hypothetical protein
MLTEQLDFEVRMSIREAGFHITMHSCEFYRSIVVKVKVQVNFTLQQATKAQRGSRL